MLQRETRQMINIKELSVGNWIKISGTPVQILGIRTESQVYVLETEEADYAYAIDADIEPIEITPEILEKNGFVNDFYIDEAVADYHFVRLEGYSLHIKELQQGGDDALVTYCNGSVNIATELHGEINKEIHFVHQLQNALTLCGINKEIRL